MRIPILSVALSSPTFFNELPGNVVCFLIFGISYSRRRPERSWVRKRPNIQRRKGRLIFLILEPQNSVLRFNSKKGSFCSLYNFIIPGRFAIMPTYGTQ